MTDSSLRAMPTRPSLLSITSSTSQTPLAACCSEPAKSTSCPVWARSWLGGCEAMAHCSASAMLDLPEPLGPTTTETPGSKRQLQRVAERLEAAHADCAQVHSRPSPSTRSSASWAAACSEAFFDGALARADDLVSEHGGGGEAAAVRWSCGFHQPVAYGRPLTCQAFLQLRLVIDEALLAVIDAFLEGLDDRICGLPVAELLEGGADHGLAERRQHVAARLDARLGAAALALPLELALEVERARHERARAARDDVGALLREPALVGPGRTAIELLGDREPEHAVAEELQSLIGLDALVDPGRVGERASPQLVGEPLDERCKRRHARR